MLGAFIYRSLGLRPLGYSKSQVRRWKLAQNVPPLLKARLAQDAPSPPLNLCAFASLREIFPLQFLGVIDNPSSDTTAPLARRITRCALAAMAKLWVAIKSVVNPCSPIHWNACMTRLAFSVSRFPVGSSAKSKLGR